MKCLFTNLTVAAAVALAGSGCGRSKPTRASLYGKDPKERIQAVKDTVKRFGKKDWSPTQERQP